MKIYDGKIIAMMYTSKHIADKQLQRAAPDGSESVTQWLVVSLPVAAAVRQPGPRSRPVRVPAAQPVAVGQEGGAG